MQQHSLRELAAELGRSKRTVQFWAQSLPDDMKQQSPSGAIMVTDAGAELIRQKAAQRTAQQPAQDGAQDRATAQASAQDDCAAAQETAQNSPELTENRAILRATAQNTAQQTAQDGATAQPDAAFLRALDALQSTIDRQAAELDRLRETAAAEHAQAVTASTEAAVLTERLNALQIQLEAAQQTNEQQAAELIQQRQQLEQLTGQLAAIADKQADTLRAGAAEQLAIAAKPEQDPEQPQRRGFLARLFHRKSE